MSKYFRIKYNAIKFIKFPLIIFFSIFSLLLLYILKNLYKTELSLLRPDRIGHLAGEPDIFLRKQQLSKFRSKYRRVIVTGPPCNKELVNLLNRYVPIVVSQFGYKVLLISSRTRAVKKYLKPLGLDSQAYALYKSSSQVVKLNSKEEERGYSEIKEKFGINEGSWWVCFHARDSAYLGTQQYGYHSYRDNDIANMQKAMDFVTSLGGYAIRYGSSAEKRLNSENPMIIDYASSKNRTEFLDLFLCAKARIFIGNTSGPRDLAKMFSVPHALTNLIGYTHLTATPKTLFAPKKIMNSQGNILSFDECADLGLFDPILGRKFCTTEAFSNLGLTPIENSEIEILGIVKDMFKMIENIEQAEEIKNLQIGFKAKYFNYSKDIMDAGELAPSFIKLNAKLFD